MEVAEEELFTEGDLVPEVEAVLEVGVSGGVASAAEVLVEAGDIFSPKVLIL